MQILDRQVCFVLGFFNKKKNYKYLKGEKKKFYSQNSYNPNWTFKSIVQCSLTGISIGEIQYDARTVK